jgi:hypothetical protein
MPLTAEEAAERQRQSDHARAQLDQIKSFLSAEMAKMETRIVEKTVVAPVAAAAASPPLLPRWAATVLAIGGGVVTLSAAAAAILAIFNAYAGYQVQGRENTARIVALETWRAQIAASNLPAEVREMKQSNETAKRIRDQQFQALQDQVAQLRQSDSVAQQQSQSLIQSNVQLQTRMEDIIRQLSEIKSQLNRGSLYLPPGTQRGNEEAPAFWFIPPAKGT